jgi:hypothetical protein
MNRLYAFAFTVEHLLCFSFFRIDMITLAWLGQSSGVG